jgi:hypothetical protein
MRLSGCVLRAVAGRRWLHALQASGCVVHPAPFHADSDVASVVRILWSAVAEARCPPPVRQQKFAVLLLCFCSLLVVHLFSS